MKSDTTTHDIEGKPTERKKVVILFYQKSTALISYAVVSERTRNGLVVAQNKQKSDENRKRTFILDLRNFTLVRRSHFVSSIENESFFGVSDHRRRRSAWQWVDDIIWVNESLFIVAK